MPPSVKDPLKAPSRLGRGLAALIGDVGEAPAAGAPAGLPQQRRLPTAFLRPNPRNPRKDFGEEQLDELARSVRDRGIVQPIVVRPVAGEDDQFEIVAGERRWRAAQKAGLHEVPVVVVELSDKEALEVAIVENVQRADLNPLEEALGYEQLVREFGYTQEALARVIGKSRSHVANTLRLLKLPETVKTYLRSGWLTAGHARTLVGHPDPEAAARRIVELDLTVREAEAAGRTGGVRGGAGGATRAARDADTRALEKALGDALGLDVAIVHRSNGGGELRIRYASLDQLDVICRRLKG